jgi:2-oxopent-4-enoate/cis-2-oxohex-4-enoate hydratase
LENKDSIKQKWYSSLQAAKENATPVDGLASSAGKLSIEEAYHVQDMLIEARLRKGHKFIGWKVGATSQSVMRQLKIDEPIYGCMTSESQFSFLQKVRASDFCKLAVEGEIALIMGEDLQEPGFTTADVISATAGIMGAVELVDCRTKGWKPSIEEAVADNSLHAGFMLGPVMKSPTDFNLTQEGVILRKNGKLLASACGAEALGDPVRVVAWLANKLANSGRNIKNGEVVLTGSLTEFFFVEPNDTIDVSFSNLGNIQFSVGE